MSDSGSSTGAKGTSLTKWREVTEIDRRRRIVAKLRYVFRYSEPQIVEALRKEKPPIHATQPIVSRDLVFVRKNMQRTLHHNGFNAANEILRRLAGYEHRETWAMEEAKKCKPGAAAAAYLRVANECARYATDLLQDVGLLDRKLGMILLMTSDDDARKLQRVPAGDELRKYFESVRVTEGEIVSEAEKAWLYGDAAAAEQAAAAYETRTPDPPDRSTPPVQTSEP
jgi:hypothetical protein